MIVVPMCLQMGWCESPAFFCSALETVCDLAQHLLTKEHVLLPPHRLEHLCLPSNKTLPTITVKKINFGLKCYHLVAN